MDKQVKIMSEGLKQIIELRTDISQYEKDIMKKKIDESKQMTNIIEQILKDL